MLYYTEKILGLKERKVLIFTEIKQFKFPPFWRTRVLFRRVISTSDIPPHIPR